MKSAFIRSLIVSIAVASLVLAVPSPATKPASKPSDKSSKEEAPLNPVLQKAADELAKEMEAVVANPTKAKRQEKCNYLAKEAGKIQQPDLIAAISRRLNKNPAVDAYIKWQLLSAQATPFDESYSKQLVDIYRRTPVPPARLGSTPEVEKQLLQSIQNVTEEQKDVIDKINTEWKDKVGQQDNIYQPMMDYRSELYTRLPKTVEAVRAGFDDVSSRTDAGYETDPFLKKVTGDLRALAASMKPVEINQWINLMQHISGKTGPYYYKYVRVNSKSRKVEWYRSRTGFDKKLCDTLAADLTSMTK